MLDPGDRCIVTRVVTDTLRAMPTRWAEAWVLVNLRGLTHQEAADVLGVTQQRVSYVNESARRALVKELLA